MSPTVFREKGYRFFFFSLEESRMHIHVRSRDGEAKFWLEPEIALAKRYRLSDTQVRDIERRVEAHKDELIAAWTSYFGDSGH